MFSLLSFVVANADGSQPTTCTVDPVNGVLDLNGPDIPLACLSDFAEGCTQLLDQPRGDGEHSTRVQVEGGGPELTYTRGATPDDDLLKVHGSFPAGWSRGKVVGGLLAALAAYNLI